MPSGSTRLNDTLWIDDNVTDGGTSSISPKWCSTRYAASCPASRLLAREGNESPQPPTRQPRPAEGRSVSLFVTDLKSESVQDRASTINDAALDQTAVTAHRTQASNARTGISQIQHRHCGVRILTLLSLPPQIETSLLQACRADVLAHLTCCVSPPVTSSVSSTGLRLQCTADEQKRALLHPSSRLRDVESSFQSPASAVLTVEIHAPSLLVYDSVCAHVRFQGPSPERESGARC